MRHGVGDAQPLPRLGRARELASQGSGRRCSQHPGVGWSPMRHLRGWAWEPPSEVQPCPHGRWPRRSCAPCLGRSSRLCTRSPPSTSWTEPYLTGPRHPPTTCPSTVVSAGGGAAATWEPGPLRCHLGSVLVQGRCHRPGALGVGVTTLVPDALFTCTAGLVMASLGASCITGGQSTFSGSPPSEWGPGGAPSAGAASGCENPAFRPPRLVVSGGPTQDKGCWGGGHGGLKAALPPPAAAHGLRAHSSLQPNLLLFKSVFHGGFMAAVS